MGGRAGGGALVVNTGTAVKDGSLVLLLLSGRIISKARLQWLLIHYLPQYANICTIF